MNSPLISIIIPCYNQGAFLNESLESVYNQTYANWECIIVNDGSTDNSEKIAKHWVDKDIRFKYFHKENDGVSSARNFALQKVKGDFIQFLDADDIIHQKKLELSYEVLKKENFLKKTIVITNFEMFFDNAKVTSPPYCILNVGLFNYESLLYKWNETFSIPIHCGFFEHSVFETIRFPENLTAQEDWLVWVKIFKQGVKAIFLDEPLALYRKNPESRTKTKSLHDDQLLVYENFKPILSEEEYHELSKVLISRYFKTQEVYKNRLSKVKNSNSYQTGLMIKKVLKKVGLLRVFVKLFPLFLKFKTKTE